MILVLKQDCSPADIENIVSSLRGMGIGVSDPVIRSGARTLLAAHPADAELDANALEDIPGVEWAVPTVGSPEPHRETLPRLRNEVQLPGGASFGGQKLGIIAGPCSVESEEQVMAVAEVARASGAVALRGGAFKPRTNPYSFQGLGERGLELLAAAREASGLAIVTEVMAPDQVELVARYADVLQIGTRNMHNFNLLSAVGQAGKPVVLKRGWSATLEEWLHAAEYVLQAGSPDIILCERGIRTFERHTRNTLALAVVPSIKQRSPLPIIVDPSQGTGHAALVAPMSKAAIACGADGLIIEVHPQPKRALTDGQQSLDVASFQALMADLRPVAEAVGRSI